MCFSDWLERKQALEQLEKSRREADAVIKRVQSTELQRKEQPEQPAVERKEATT